MPPSSLTSATSCRNEGPTQLSVLCACQCWGTTRTEGGPGAEQEEGDVFV